MDVRAGSAWRPVALWFRELSGVAGKSDIDLKASFDFDGHFTAEEKGQDSGSTSGALQRGSFPIISVGNPIHTYPGASSIDYGPYI